MFEIFLEEKLISAGILVFFVSSILMRVFLGALYQNMIQEAENMATTNHKLLKQCKLKFSHCYQMNNGVSNVPVFVDRFMGRLAFGSFSFENIYHLSGQTMLLSVVCAGIGICKGISEGRTLGTILPYYVICMSELYLYFSISGMLDIQGKKQLLKVNLVDYLENHFSPRIGETEDSLDMLYGRGGAAKNVTCGGRSKSGKKTVEFTPIVNHRPAVDAINSANSVEEPEEEKRTIAFSATELEELLQEFLTT